MPRHKFEHVPFDEGRMHTHHAILDQLPYNPKVLIIGTFNPASENNVADFFYGRNYFWRVFENLVNGNALLNGRRDDHDMIPTLPRIIEICKQMKLSFADLILGNDNLQIDDFEDATLNDFGLDGQLEDNVNNIVKYINLKETIQHVYFTTKCPQLAWIWNLWTQVQNGVNRDVNFGSIVTPSGQGGFQNFPEMHRAATIARYWIWVNNPAKPDVQWDGYVHFDHEWLIECGVDPNLF